MLSLLVYNNRLPLFHMDKKFIFPNETKQHINEFTIGYMINPGLNVNKAFQKKWENVCILHFLKSHNLLLKPHY